MRGADQCGAGDVVVGMGRWLTTRTGQAYPQDWINWYALLPLDNRITRFLFALVKLSVVMALGLVVGLRL